SAFITAGSSRLSPTQAFYPFAVRAAAQSWSYALFPLATDPNSCGNPSPWNTTVEPQGDGMVLFQPQFSSLPGWTNFANSNYHSLQLSVRKNMKNASFAANYVWSKSIDNDSAPENQDLPDIAAALTNGTLNGLIQNPF